MKLLLILCISIGLILMTCQRGGEGSRKKRELHVNTFLYMTYEHAKTSDRTSCWVCAHIPTHTKGGIPLRSIPFNTSETAEWVIRRNSSRDPDKTSDVTQWRSAGYNLTTFQGWYQPNYNHTRTPPFLVLTNTSGAGRPQGALCFKKQAEVSRMQDEKEVGESSCNQTVVWQPPIPGLFDQGFFQFDWTKVNNKTSRSPWTGDPI